MIGAHIIAHSTKFAGSAVVAVYSTGYARAFDVADGGLVW